MKMNVIRPLVSFLVVILAAGICFSSAAVEMEKSGGKLNRRDLQSFQTQLATVFKPLDLSSSGVCPNPCEPILDASQCGGLLGKDLTKFGAFFKIITDCYPKGICKNNLVTTTLPDVNVSLPTPANYNGQCYLYGSLATFTFSLNSAAPKFLDTNSYYTSQAISYTITGLSVHCQPCPTSPPPPKPTPCPTCQTCPTTDNSQSGSGSGGGGGNCCNDLVSKLLCLVENLLSFLSIQLVECDCSCPDKRAAPESDGAAARELSQRQAAAAAFDSAVTAALSISFTFFFHFDPSGGSVFALPGDIKASSTVSLGAEVPSAYKPDLVAGIQSVFNDYNVFYPLLNSYAANIENVLQNFFLFCI